MSIEILRVLWSRRFRAHGYELRREVIGNGGGGDVTVTSAYTLAGDWIGGAEDARRLCVKYGIRPELRTRASSVCSVGKSIRDGRWYGWSHRAIASFKTRAAAARFARSVS